MSWSRVEELTLASKAGSKIYELRNLELTCVARVSDQHKHHGPEKKRKKAYKTQIYGARLLGLKAAHPCFKLRVSQVQLGLDLGAKWKCPLSSLVWITQTSHNFPFFSCEMEVLKNCLQLDVVSPG